jgi:hypothetical protein
MKKRFVLIAIVMVIALAFSACRTTPDPVSDFIREARVRSPENALLGIGTSNHSNRGLARSTAETRARAEIARQVETMVSNMIIDYTGGSEAEQRALLSFQENVTRTLTQQTQRGAIIRDETNINGEQITIVMLTADSLRNELMSAIQSAAALAPHMGSAMWALERMDAEIEAANRGILGIRNYD